MKLAQLVLGVLLLTPTVLAASLPWPIGVSTEARHSPCQNWKGGIPTTIEVFTGLSLYYVDIRHNEDAGVFLYQETNGVFNHAVHGDLQRGGDTAYSLLTDPCTEHYYGYRDTYIV